MEIHSQLYIDHIKNMSTKRMIETFLAIEDNSLREPNNYRDIFKVSDKKDWLITVKRRMK